MSIFNDCSMTSQTKYVGPFTKKEFQKIAEHAKQLYHAGDFRDDTFGNTPMERAFAERIAHCNTEEYLRDTLTTAWDDMAATGRWNHEAYATESSLFFFIKSLLFNSFKASDFPSIHKYLFAVEAKRTIRKNPIFANLIFDNLNACPEFVEELDKDNLSDLQAN